MVKGSPLRTFRGTNPGFAESSIWDSIWGSVWDSCAIVSRFPYSQYPKMVDRRVEVVELCRELVDRRRVHGVNGLRRRRLGESVGDLEIFECRARVRAKESGQRGRIEAQRLQRRLQPDHQVQRDRKVS